MDNYKVKSSRFERRVDRAKLAARSELKLFQWDRHGYAGMNWWIRADRDTLVRIEYSSTSIVEFIRRFEKPALPCVIRGVAEEWPAKKEWTVEVARR